MAPQLKFSLLSCCFLFLASSNLMTNVSASSLSTISQIVPSMKVMANFTAGIEALEYAYAQLPSTVKDQVYIEPEASMTAPELIRNVGYPAEIHTVITLDGYILQLHRIPHGKDNVSSELGVPVFMQHGLLCSSDEWVNNFSNESMAFALADNGYDVWLGNVRGNTYSTNHEFRNPQSKGFWDFSYDEMAKYDMPAMLNYVLEETGQTQLHLIGHSMGTTMSFAFLSTQPEFHHKIKSFIALAPVATLGNLDNQALDSVFRSDIDLIGDLIDAGYYYFFPSNAEVKHFAQTVCAVSPIDLGCVAILQQLGGTVASTFNTSRLPVYFSHYPAGASAKTFQHYAQNVRSNKFAKFDYGLLGNLLRYLSINPPVYDLTKVAVPTGIISASNDILSTPADVLITYSQLPYKLGFQEVANYNHFDVLWGTDVGVQVTQTVLSWLNSTTG